MIKQNARCRASKVLRMNVAHDTKPPQTLPPSLPLPGLLEPTYTFAFSLECGTDLCKDDEVYIFLNNPGKFSVSCTASTVTRLCTANTTR